MDAVAGKVVVITGASSGLGAAAARSLSASGAHVVLGARRMDRIQALAEVLSVGGHKALAVQTDVTRFGDVERLVGLAVETFGRIDVMINNAGVMTYAPLNAGSTGDWDRMIDVNLKGVLNGIAAALPQMKQQLSGHFINVSSVAAHRVSAGSAVYSATKAAIRVISEGLRQEVKPFNIRTTVICPGLVQSEIPEATSTLWLRKQFERFTTSWRFLRTLSLVRCCTPSGSQMTWISMKLCFGQRARRPDLIAPAET